jgi:hypothetical protein
MENRTTWTRIMSAVLVVVVAITLVMPITSYAMIRTIGGGGGLHPQYVVTDYSNGVVAQSTPYGTVNHGGYHAPTTSTLSQSTPTMSTKEVITITKTYTQTIYYTTVINNIITKYMMPIIKYEFTLVNIGQYQEAGYHSLNHEELFLPGYGSGGIFVPVFAQEAVYTYNIAPSTKPVITGWYVGSQSQSTSTSTSRSATPPQLSSIQQAVDNAQQAVNTINQLATTSGRGLASTTYVYYSNTLFNTNTQYVTNQPPSPFYYSPQYIAVAYLTGNLYEQQAVSDLLHGNIIGAVQSFGTSLYYYGKGVYEQAYNFGAGVVNTLASFTYNSQNPQSIAHALSTGNILNAITTGASMVWNALTSGWSKAFGFG